MKKLLLIILAVIVIAVGYYLLSPLWRVVEVDDELAFDDAQELEEPEELEELEDEEEAMEILPPVEMDEPMPEVEVEVGEETEVIVEVASGVFVPDAHDVAGSASVYESGDQRILRFEDFDTVNGPNLHIYLATDTEATDYIDLGEIRATKGNVNYEIESAIDLSVYDHVLVWCVPFKVNFSYAVLN